MTQINTCLTFYGNCREAMAFYRDCFGGTLRFQTVGESPGTDQLPGPLKRAILQTALLNDQVILLGSDMVTEQGLITGNAVSLMLRCSGEDELKGIMKTCCQVERRSILPKILTGCVVRCSPE